MIITCCCTYCQCQWEIILTMKLPITMIMITITGTITKTPIPILEEPCFITFCYQWKQWYDNNNNSGDNNLFSPSIVTLPLILERISSGGKTCTENSSDDSSRKYNITNSATPRCQNQLSKMVVFKNTDVCSLFKCMYNLHSKCQSKDLLWKISKKKWFLPNHRLKRMLKISLSYILALANATHRAHRSQEISMQFAIFAFMRRVCRVHFFSKRRRFVSWIALQCEYIESWRGVRRNFNLNLIEHCSFRHTSHTSPCATSAFFRKFSTCVNYSTS